MRRALLLLALVVLLIWLINASPQQAKGEFRSSWFYSRTATAPPSAVMPDPPCGGCDPNDESYCINNAGSWNPDNCTCTYGCDPYQEQQCYSEGGYWDSDFCTCQYPSCDPGGPEVVGQTGYQYQYCDGWEIWDCEGTWTDYAEYCQDGSLYSSWTEFTEVCYGTGDGCGDDGCNYDPESCCDYGYCS